MPLSKTIEDREFQKFGKTLGNETGVRIIDFTKTGWKKVEVTQNSPTSETFEYKDASDNVLDALTITYSDASRKTLVSVERA